MTQVTAETATDMDRANWMRELELAEARKKQIRAELNELEGLTELWRGLLGGEVLLGGVAA